MIKGIDGILLFSENAAALAEFYIEKLGFKISYEGEIGDEGEEVYVFDFTDGTGFAILDHSKIKGKRKEPERIMFNLQVDNIAYEVSNLEKQNVKKIQDIYRIEGYGLIATFEDMDGNYFQLVEIEEVETDGNGKIVI